MSPSFNSCFASVKFSKRYTTGAWKPSSCLIPPSLLRSDQPPSCPPPPPASLPPCLPGPPSRSRSLFPPQTSRRPAPRPPRLARAADPSPSPPHVQGAQLAVGPTHQPNARHSFFAALPSRALQPQAEEAQGQPPSCLPVRREDALRGAGLRSPLTRPLRAEPRPPLPTLAEPPRPSPGAQPLGRRPGTAPPPPSARPVPVLPATS